MASLRIAVISRLTGLDTELTKRCPNIAGNIQYAIPNIKWSENFILGAKVPPFAGETHEILSNSDVILADLDLLIPYMYNIPNVKWVQSTYTGVDCLFAAIDHSKAFPSFVLTRYAGKYGPHMSDYVLANIVNWERRFKEAWEFQKKSKWNANLAVYNEYRLLNTLSIGILGVGDIGKCVARACKMMGMLVYGMTSEIPSPDRKCKFIDSYYTSDNLENLLKQSDYFVNILPKTKGTDGMLSGEVLKVCKERKSIFINIGRGNVIKENDIITAIDNGWIGGAILDVFENEPLDSSSVLWEMDKVVITPHIAGNYRSSDIADICAENIRLFEKNQPLKYVVDWSKEY